MVRRGHPCRCCGCNDCESEPTLLRAHVTYHDGSGEIYPATTYFGEEYAAVTTNCSVSSDRVSVASVRVTDPGEDYTSAPTVTFSGGGGTGAAAIATVSLESGTLENVSLTSGGSGYGSPPTVTLSGGGGTGAKAVAELVWQQQHERTAPFVSCQASLAPFDTPLCLDAFSDDPPFDLDPAGCASDQAEAIDWSVLARSSNEASDDDFFGFSPTQPATSRSFFFEGESVWARVVRIWSTGTPLVLPQGVISQRTLTYFCRRFFSRVPPNVVYRMTTPGQQPDDNVTLTPTFRQYVDVKEDSFWYLESLQVTDGGDNLNIPADTATFVLEAEGNARHQFVPLAVTISRGTPEAVPDPIVGFSVQPEITIELTPLAGSDVNYTATGATVVSGGVTDRDDGPVPIEVSLTKGHFAGERLLLSGTVTNGELTAVSLSTGGVILAPATVDAVQLPDDEYFNSPSRITTGESSFMATRSHSEPTVVAESQGDTEDAVFAVTLEQNTDLNGDDYWSVKSVGVSSGGNGYGQSSAVTFSVDAPSIEAAPALASIVLDRDEPTVLAEPSPFFPGGGAVLTPVLTKQETPEGDFFWSISSVSVDNGGGGYSTGVPVVFSNPSTLPEEEAEATISTSSGAIVGVNVTKGGRWYDVSDRVRRVVVENGGKYFMRSISETETPLPPIACIGPVSTGTGWDKNELELVEASNADISVGGQFPAYNGNPLFGLPTVNRTRRCDLPVIDLEFE